MSARGPLLGAVVLAALLAASGAKGASHGHTAAAARHGAASTAGYVNPFAGQQWTPARTDQGVDFHPDVPEPVRAIGDGTVVYSSTTDAGWPGGAFIAYRLATGRAAGRVIYVAEYLTGLAPVGAHVRAGQQIATAWPRYPWIETGWGCSGVDLPAVRYDRATYEAATPGGLAFARFLRGLGADTLQDPGPGPDTVRSC